MQLALHRVHYGNKRADRPAILILPGLLSNARSWAIVAKALGQHFHTIALDLRGHGQSPSAPISFEAMTEDVLAVMEAEGLSQCIFLGHSMGGKLAMRLATHFAPKVHSLVVVDIAPKPYPVYSRKDFECIDALNLADYDSRGAVEIALRKWVSDEGKLRFLLSNLVRHEARGPFSWQMDASTLTDSLNHVNGHLGVEVDGHYNGPTLFLYSERSGFIDPSKDVDRFLMHFPQAKMVAFANSGHNPHIDERARFVEEMMAFWEALR